MKVELIDTNNQYRFERIKQNSSESTNFAISHELQTAYIHSGNAILEIKYTDAIQQIELNTGDGFVVTPSIEFRLTTKNQFDMFKVSSNVENGPIIEVIDDGENNREVPIKDYKIIKDPKRVKKPWGHEIWINWTNFHVMKQIKMNAGNQCSLQFHREKIETNYILKGEAEVIYGYKVDPQSPEDKIRASSMRVDFCSYKKRMKQGMHWTSEPGTIHRVISIKTYLAYEVSTPELDDVIRLQDDTRRQSGRIKSEHRVK